MIVTDIKYVFYPEMGVFRLVNGNTYKTRIKMIYG